MQGTIRSFPHPFLAKSVLVCEGASEIGLMLGLDQHRVSTGLNAFTAFGLTLVKSDGGKPDRFFDRANPLLKLGYRTGVFRDDDQKPDPTIEGTFITNGGKVFTWPADRALEQHLFMTVSDDTVSQLLDYAVELHGDQKIDNQIKTASGNKSSYAEMQESFLFDSPSKDHRTWLGDAAKKSGWFKKTRWMEYVGREIVGPDLIKADPTLRDKISEIFDWAADGSA